MIVFEKLNHPKLRLTREIFRTPFQRISIAFGFSVLMHTVIMWLPNIHLSHEKVQLPPLSARMEVLLEKVVSPEAIAQPEERYELVSKVNSPGRKASGKSLAKISSTMKKMERSEISHQFPKHLHLSFAVYKGAGHLRIGELIHQLEILNDRYTLTAVKRIARISGMPGQELFIQTSHGLIGEPGLHPETYKEEVSASGKKQNLKVNFDWEAQRLRFSNGGDVALPESAQDVLSFMYQNSQISMEREIVSFSVATGTAVEQYEFEIGRPEEIESPMGPLHAFRLRQLHKKGESYFEIWLGLEYRFLPVMFRQINAAGEVIEKSIISDIRASED